MRCHEKIIHLPHGKTMNLFVFGDLQFGADGFNQELWDRFKADFKAADNAYAIGLGDYGDWLRPSIRSQLTNAMTSDRSAREMMDEMVMKKLEETCGQLDFMKGRILGLHSGHHEWDFLSGVNSSQILCQWLDTTYLTWTAYTVLKLRSSKKKGASSTAVKIWSTHGCGGGSYHSSDLGALEKRIAPYWIADLYLRGHSSKLEMIPVDQQDVTVNGPEPRHIKKTRWLVNSGAFMKGYLDRKMSYVERGNMPPASQGWAVVQIKFSNSFKDASGKAMTGVEMQPFLRSPSVIS